MLILADKQKLYQLLFQHELKKSTSTIKFILLQKETASNIDPKHNAILFVIAFSILSSKCLFGSCLPTCLVFNWSLVMVVSSNTLLLYNSANSNIVYKLIVIQRRKELEMIKKNDIKIRILLWQIFRFLACDW